MHTAITVHVSFLSVSKNLHVIRNTPWFLPLLRSYIKHSAQLLTFSLQEMTLPVLSMLHDVTQHHVFFLYHSNQRDSVDIILSKVMTSVVTSRIEFRFSTLDSVIAAHPCFSVEQVGLLVKNACIPLGTLKICAESVNIIDFLTSRLKILGVNECSRS